MNPAHCPVELGTIAQGGCGSDSCKGRGLRAPRSSPRSFQSSGEKAQMLERAEKRAARLMFAGMSISVLSGDQNRGQLEEGRANYSGGGPQVCNRMG